MNGLIELHVAAPLPVFPIRLQPACGRRGMVAVQPYHGPRILPRAALSCPTCWEYSGVIEGHVIAFVPHS